MNLTKYFVAIVWFSTAAFGAGAHTLLPNTDATSNSNVRNSSVAIENSTQNSSSGNINSLADLKPENIIELCKLILSVPLDNGNNSAVAMASIGVLINWLGETDDITMGMSSNVMFIVNDENSALLGAYLAAETYTMLSDGLKTNNGETYLVSMKRVLEYYKRNRKYLPKVKLLDKWLKLDGEKLDKAIMKQYDKK